MFDLEAAIITQEMIRILIKIGKKNELPAVAMPALVEAFQAGATYYHKHLKEEKKNANN